MHHSSHLEVLMKLWDPSFGQGKEKSFWPQCWLLRAQPLDFSSKKVAFQDHTVQYNTVQ